MNTEELLKEALTICQRVTDNVDVDPELLRIVFMQLTMESHVVIDEAVGATIH